ncbi:hypothetical protein BC831DRAFT_452630, partial [Entophlyctis helioformis]
IAWREPPAMSKSIRRDLNPVSLSACQPALPCRHERPLHAALCSLLVSCRSVGCSNHGRVRLECHQPSPHSTATGDDAYRQAETAAAADQTRVCRCVAIAACCRADPQQHGRQAGHPAWCQRVGRHWRGSDRSTAKKGQDRMALTESRHAVCKELPAKAAGRVSGEG